MISIAHRLEYVALRVAEGIMTTLPRFWALRLGSAVGMLLYHLHVRRRIAELNMRHVGYWSPAESRTILRNLYRFTGRYVADFLRPSTGVPPHTIQNVEILDRLFARNKGVIVLMAHFGNWEILANVFGSRINGLSSISKPMKNELVTAWLWKKRNSAGLNPIPQHRALKQIVSILRKNGMIVGMVDQFAGKDASISEFLGKPANTIRSIGWLVQKLDCAVLPVYALLGADDTYTIVLEDLPAITVPADPEEATTAYQQQHNDVFTRWIRAHPEHYFGWFHRRFKRRGLEY